MRWGIDVQLILDTVPLQLDEETGFSICIDSKIFDMPLSFLDQSIPIGGISRVVILKGQRCQG